MPKLSFPELVEEFEKIEEPNFDDTHLDYYDDRYSDTSPKVDLTKPDSIQLLGMVVEPHREDDYDDYGEEYTPIIVHDYHIGVLDTESEQKYALHFAYTYHDDIPYASFHITEIDEDLEYTHKPKETTFIKGFSIFPHEDGPYCHQSPFIRVDDPEERKKVRTYKIGDAYYKVNNLFHGKIINNVFYCSPRNDWEDYGGFSINENVFEILPEMKEKLAQKEANIRFDIQKDEIEPQSKEERLQQIKDAYHKLKTDEQKKKKQEQAQTRAEIKMYEDSRKGRKQTTLDEVVIHKLNAKRKVK